MTSGFQCSSYFIRGYCQSQGAKCCYVADTVRFLCPELVSCSRNSCVRILNISTRNTYFFNNSGAFFKGRNTNEHLDQRGVTTFMPVIPIEVVPCRKTHGKANLILVVIFQITIATINKNT